RIDRPDPVVVYVDDVEHAGLAVDHQVGRGIEAGAIRRSVLIAGQAGAAEGSTNSRSRYLPDLSIALFRNVQVAVAIQRNACRQGKGRIILVRAIDTVFQRVAGKWRYVRIRRNLADTVTGCIADK